MSNRESPVKPTERRGVPNPGNCAKPSQVSPDQFYQKVTSRPDIRELLRRLAKR